MWPPRLGIASMLRPAIRRRPRPRLRPSAEPLERRLVLDASGGTYTWTALGDGTSFDDPNNWSHPGSYTGSVGVPGVPSLGSNLVFPPLLWLPANSPATINFNGNYGSYPFGSITIDDSYTFDGNAVAVGNGIVVANAAFVKPTDATILLAGVNLSRGATIAIQPGATLNLGDATNLTGVQLTLQDGLTVGGGGQLVVDTQTVTQPRYGFQLQTFEIAGSTVTLGTTVNFSNCLFQIDANSTLDVADDAAVEVGSLSGSGSVDLEGTGAAGDTTGLTAFTPAGESDQLSGPVGGDGQLTMQGNGTLALGGIDLGAGSAVDVALGTLDVDGPLAAGSLQVGGTLGGLGSWHVSGPVTFQPGGTFDLTLDGLVPGTQSTRLTSGDATTGITLGNSTLAGTVNYEYQAGDQFTIATGPLVQGAFQNVGNGLVLLGGNIPFSVTYSGTAVTLTAQQSETTTQLASSGNPSHPGQALTFTATVATRTMPVGVGTVSFLIGGAVAAIEPVGPDGTATFTTTGLPLGSSTLTAVYNGYGNTLGSTSAAVTQVVVPYTTATTVASAPNPSRVGQPVTLTATVTADGMPVTSGNVTFFRGSVLIGVAPLGPDGTASLTTTSLPRKNVHIQANYAGSADDYGSVSRVYIQGVQRVGTATALSVSIQPGRRGRTVLVATVAPTDLAGVIPDGTVVFRRAGRTIGRGGLVNGTATLVLAGRRPARGRFVASFQQNTRFGASHSSALVLPS